jgi:cytochrome P450
LHRAPHYRFPPGLKYNLLWYTLGRFRPGNPIKLFEHLAREYGDAAHYKLGPQHVLFINHPDFIWQLLIGQHEKFVRERTVRRSRLLLGEGMITADGSSHRRQRQAAQPAFHRHKIAAYATTMVEIARRTRDSWQPGETRDVALEMIHLALGVVAKTLFGTDLGQEVRELAAAINSIMSLYHYMVALPAAELLVHFPLPHVGTFKRARARLDATVYRMIDQHRESPDSGDLLHLMLAAFGSDDRVFLRDQVITIFLAGYETVANALTWTWYLLSQNPDAESRLHAEVDRVLSGRCPTAEEYPRLRYTEMVFAESMRLYPPAWAMGRKAVEPSRSALIACRRPPPLSPASTSCTATRDSFPTRSSFDPIVSPHRRAAT